MKKRRRRLFVFHLGNPVGRPYDAPKPVEMLKRASNIKVKILKTCLTGISRAAVDLHKGILEVGEYGYPVRVDPFAEEPSYRLSRETVLSIIGTTYTSVQKISMYAYPEDEEIIKVIINGCGLHILDPDELPQMLK